MFGMLIKNQSRMHITYSIIDIGDNIHNSFREQLLNEIQRFSCSINLHKIQHTIKTASKI